ncbi:response regulator [Methanohalophilus sp. WG1-DM]|uniref:response regulator n=1 Tax=Methanohalophilus sp. WG1-DM TaxID=2491675 RepID=UPI000FFEADF5|nr:response regulator [Methanohalophilus sp. WG1-DM]RXG34296.1 two-component hybrid sensor and regulator [Methanohalophilus sp. WG1-DM]
MVIEDDYSSRDLLVSTVVNAGYRVLPLSRGYLESRYVDVVKPFAILLDIMMPGMNGWDVLGSSSGSPSSILVVDDDPSAVEMLKSSLDIEGYNVIPAYGGQEAIDKDKAFSYSPDLIILDLMMLITSGFDVMATLRENSNTADIPIIIHTAKDMERKRFLKVM